MLIIYMQITTNNLASCPASFVITVLRSGRTSAEEIFVTSMTEADRWTQLNTNHPPSGKRSDTTSRTASAFPIYSLPPHIQTIYRRPKQWSGEGERKTIHISKSRTMDPIQKFKTDYPWIQTPLIVGAPMRLIALADLAVAISKAGTYRPSATHRRLYSPYPHITIANNNTTNSALRNSHCVLH